MTELLDALRANKEREKRIKELKETDPRLNEKEIIELLNRMRKSYRGFIVQHPEFVYGNNQTETSLNENESIFFFRSNEKDQYDIAGQLWKTCFYKQISEFRSSLKRHTMQLENLMSNASTLSTQIGEPYKHSDEAQDAAGRHERLYIARLTQAFLSFLSDSIAFYQKMLNELEDRAKREIGAMELRRCVTSMHKCLLYLGDLARYREMYQDKEGKDFAEAQRYYERAALIDPGSGNAQNQLAVLATYCEAECVSVYHYCRSILATSPFAGSFENLSLLLSKNATAFAQLRPLPPASSRSRRQIAAHTGVLLVRFVHLHGQLFSRSTIMHHSYSELLQHSQSQAGTFSGSHSNSQHWLPQLSQAVTQANSAHDAVDQEKFSAELRLVLDEFDVQLAAGNLPDVLLVRLLAISLFSVHYAVGRDANLLAWGEEICSSEGMLRYLRTHSEHGHTSAESLALHALYGLVNRAATRVSEMMNNNDRGCRSTMNKTLPMLSVFATWAQLHTNYMHQTCQPVVPNGTNKSTDSGNSALHLQEEDIAPPSMFQDSPPCSMRSTAFAPGSQSSQDWENTFLADPELLRTEVRARAGVRASMASLKAVLEADMRSNEHFETAGASSSGEEGSQYLREHIELRGFLPLVSLIEQSSFALFNPLSRSLSVMSEPLARYHRQSIVLAFIADAVATAPSGALTTGPTGNSLNTAAKVMPSKKVRSDRKQDGERIEISSVTPLPTSAVKRGPPAIASEDRIYVAPSNAAQRQQERVIPPSMQDFPALPSSFRRDSLNDPTAPETAAFWDGTGTAREEDEEEEEDLDDTVVFKSAFVRSPQHTSNNSLAAATSVSGTATGFADDHNMHQLSFDILPDFLRSPLASPQQKQEEQNLFQDLLQGGVMDTSFWSSAEVGAPVPSPWGYPTTTTTLGRETADEAPHFDVFSYLDPELPSSSLHSTGSTLQSPFFSSLGGPTGAFDGAFPPFYGQQQSQRSSSIVLGPQSGQQQVPATAPPPGLSSLRDSSNSTPGIGAGSAHSSSNSLHRPATSRLCGGAAPPPGLG